MQPDQSIKIKGVTALCVKQDSIYKNYLEDCFDKDRNAYTFKGANTVIAHPPCGAYGRLRKFCTHDQSTRYLAIHCTNIIQNNGGILEHPAWSKLWEIKQLPIPGQPADRFGGISISIDQSWFGFDCKKNTWLYIVGIKLKDLPLIPISFDAITKTISTSKRKNIHVSGKREIPNRQRDITVPAFARWLIETAQLIAGRS